MIDQVRRLDASDWLLVPSDELASSLVPAPRAAQQPALPGLVLSAITGRTSSEAPSLAAPTSSRGFPSADLVEAATALFERHGWNTQQGSRRLFPGEDGSGDAAQRDRLTEEGVNLSLSVGPGVVALRSMSLTRSELVATARRERELRELLEGLSEDGEHAPEGALRGSISDWSWKSRARMVRSIAELDWRPLVEDASGRAAMVTLTYSDQWETFAPDGETFKAHLKALRKRSQRAWGRDMLGIWKLEFQGRGAPHAHLYVVAHSVSTWSKACPDARCSETGSHVHDGAWLDAPDAPRQARKRAGEWVTYQTWLSHAWAEIVLGDAETQKAHVRSLRARLGLGLADARRLLREEHARHLKAGTGVDYDEATKNSDPKRLAVYFSKRSVVHSGVAGGKEYQHRVPALWQENGGPGRFWGYWGLQKVTSEVLLTPQAYTWTKRLLRQWQESQGRTRVFTVERTNTKTGEVKRRKARRRWSALTNGGVQGGWVLANDGPALAGSVATALERGGLSGSSVNSTQGEWVEAAGRHRVLSPLDPKRLP